VPCLFAVDQAFPLPIVETLRDFQTDAELVRLSEIDTRLAELDDWEVLLALHHHVRPWDGLITTDSSMLNEAPSLAVLEQTKLTLVIAMGAGHDPVKASGLLFAYLGRICKLTQRDEGQIWQLKAGNILPGAPEDALARVADHQNLPLDDLIAAARLDDKALAHDPLEPPSLDVDG
jgi:hypothetical protein